VVQRRNLLAISVLLLLTALLIVACNTAQPQTVEKVVERTVVVEKQVTAVVEKEVTTVVEKEVAVVVTATPEPTEAPPSEPVPGGTLRVGMIQDIPDFDAYSRNFFYWPIARNIYDTLIRYDHSLNPQPQLAESWEIADDGLSITLHLREGVKFHDGSDFTSAAVAANLERATDAARGVHQYNANRNVESWETPDDYTVVIKYSKPTPAGLMLDALDQLPIISPETLDTETLKTKAIGTGPFMVAEKVPGDHVTLKRFDGYWKEGLPYLDEIILKPFTDPDAMVLALEAGTLDFIQDTPYKDVRRLENSLVVNRGQAGALYYNLYLNVYKEPFTNKLVRQAIQYALDRETIVGQALFGVGEVKWTAWPEYSVAWDDKWKNYYPYDLEKAKALITEAGYPDGFETAITVLAGNPDMVAIAEILQADLLTIGVKTQILVLDTGTYYDWHLSGNYPGIHISFGANSNKYPAAQFTGSHYRVENNVLLKPDGFWPEAYVENVKLGEETLDPEEQHQAYVAATEAMLDESWVIEYSWKFLVFTHHPYVQGFDYTVESMPLFEAVWLAK